MFKKISYYLPKLGQSWLIAIIFIFAGQILAGVLIAPLLLLFPEFKDWGQLLMYGLAFVPVAIYVRYMIKNRWQDGAVAIYKDSKERYSAETITPPTTVKEVMQIVPDGDIEASLPSIPFNKPNFGKLGALLTFTLLIPLTLSLSIIVEPIMNWWEMPDFLKQVFEDLLSGNMILTFVNVAIMAALLEEWMCRGLIMRGLLYHIGPAKAILWSAFIFGIMHLNPWQFVPAFFMGILLGWVYWRTRSIWAAIFIHFINNGTSVLLTVLYPNFSADSSLRDMIPGKEYYIVYIAAIVTFCAIITLMHKKYDNFIIPDKIPADI